MALRKWQRGSSISVPPVLSQCCSYCTSSAQTLQVHRAETFPNKLGKEGDVYKVTNYTFAMYGFQKQPTTDKTAFAIMVNNKEILTLKTKKNHVTDYESKSCCWHKHSLIFIFVTLLSTSENWHGHVPGLRTTSLPLCSHEGLSLESIHLASPQLHLFRFVIRWLLHLSIHLLLYLPIFFSPKSNTKWRKVIHRIL